MTTRNNNTFEMMRAGLNLIQQALSIYDIDLKLVVNNRRFQEMFELPDWAVSPGADFSETLRYLAQNGEYGDVGDIEEFLISRTQQAKEFEPHYVERQRSNGRWISVEGSPLRQGGWVTVYTDITDIKRQDTMLRSHSEALSDQLLGRSEELAQTNRELASTILALEETKRQLIESEAHTRTTSEMTPAHIARMDRNEIYTYSNMRLPEIFTNRPQKIVGLTALEAIGPEGYGILRPKLHEAFSGKANVIEFDLTENSKRIRTAFTPDVDEQGQIQGAYVLSMDITQEAQARAVLMQTRKRELATQLASGLAHDFSNLLTIILGLQSELDRIADLPDRARSAIATTKTAALRGGALLDRLSDISGVRTLTSSAVNIAQLFEETRALASATLPDEITLNLANHGIEQLVLFDQGNMQDALINLILNARDAMPGSGEIEVTATERDSVWLEFCVKDTGNGFSKDALERALDPFFTTKAGDGSGLGLTMIYDFAQLSGGRVNLSNRKSGGAEVTVQLPLVYARTDFTGCMALLVEDTEEIRVSVRDMLREIGLTVIEADSAEEAIPLAHLPGITHIITDIMLGAGMTGLDLLDQLAPHQLDARTLVMTGLSQIDPLYNRAALHHQVLSKPFDTARLRAALEEQKT